MPSHTEPEEIIVASPEATYTYAGRLKDGTPVARDSEGVLHALVPIRMTITLADGTLATAVSSNP